MKQQPQEAKVHQPNPQHKHPKWLVMSLSFLLLAIILTLTCVYIAPVRPFLRFFIPPLLSAAAILFFTAILAPLIRKWKAASFKGKLAFVATLVLLMCALEMYLVNDGYQPGYVCGKDEYAALAIPSEEVQDTRQIIADEYGVTKFNSSLTEGLCSRINSEGFNSKFEFNQATIDSVKRTGRIAIALIGDSYAFGNDADPGRSYADSLEKTQKYAIFNFAVPGTDGPQYVAVAQEYIRDKKLKFDRVVVSLCGANDVYQWPKRKLTPGVPLLYFTGTANFYSQRDGEVFHSPTEAYEAMRRDATVFDMPGGSLIGKSVVASYAVRVLQVMCVAGIGPLLLFDTEKFDDYMQLAGMGVSFVQSILPFSTTIDSYKAYTITSYCDDIRNICIQSGVPVTFILIPGKEMVQSGETPKILGAASLDASHLSADNYIKEHGSAHPNSIAHEQIAGMIDAVLDSVQRVENTQHFASK
jgi:hypothetical protein